MANNDSKSTTDRRRFLGTIATGAAAMSLAAFTPITAQAENNFDPAEDGDPDMWFNKVKGKHRIVFDVVRPNDILPFAWPRVFLMTNAATKTPETDCGVVVILRHDGIPFAFEDRIWEKYKFGDFFKYNDPKTNAPSIRNPFWKPTKGDFMVPGIGEVQIGVNELQASGVMFCVCNAAISVMSAVIASQGKMDAKDVYDDWKSGLLPGIQIVPSGVWAVGRAQEHGCKYCFAG